MNQKSSFTGKIIVLISLGLILYYYLIFRHTIIQQVREHQAIIDNSSK